MRLVEILQTVGFVFWFFAMTMLAIRRRTIGTLEREQACDEAAAIVLSGSLPWHRFVRSRMEKSGVLQRTADGRYWLDRVKEEEQRRIRRRRGLTMVACVLAVGAVTLAVVLWLEGE